MHFPFLHSIKDNQPDEHPPVVTRERFQNTSEGSEFLDDALRMQDLSLPRTEESVAPGNPDYLL